MSAEIATLGPRGGAASYRAVAQPAFIGSKEKSVSVSNSTSEAADTVLPKVRGPESTLEALIKAQAPTLRLAQQLQEQNDAIVRRFYSGVDASQFYPVDAASIVKNYGLGTTVMRYEALVSSLAASPVFQMASAAGRLQTALDVGGHLNQLLSQDAWWQNSALGVELAGLAQSHVELTGWAATAFPARELLAETAGSAELWGRSVLELPEHPHLVAPVRSGRTSTALTSANLLVNLRDEEEASEEAAALVTSAVLDPWEAGRIELAGELYAVLGGFDATVPTMLRGAWHDVTVRGPAAAETTAHLVVEAIDRTLRAVTPDPQVLVEWHVKNNRPAKELHNGGPTRGLRVRYLARELKEKPLVIAQEDALTKLLTEVMGGAQGVKHASNGGLVLARSVLVSAETLLMQLFLRD